MVRNANLIYHDNNHTQLPELLTRTGIEHTGGGF